MSRGSELINVLIKERQTDYLIVFHTYIFPFLAIGAFICKMVPFVQCTAIVTEILTMTCIAMERHQGLVHPFKMKRQYTNQRAFIMLGVFITSCYCGKASELKNSNKYLSLLTGSVHGLLVCWARTCDGELVPELGGLPHATQHRQEAGGQRAMV